MDGDTGHSGEAGGVSLLFYNAIEPGEQLRIERWYEQLVERVGSDAAIGVADASGELIAVAAEHNRAGRRAMRALYGQAAIDRCRMGELPATSDRTEATKRQVKRKRITARVREFLGAVTGAHVPDDILALRLGLCESNACGHLRVRGGKLYCGACGCPKWHLAELHVKLRFANLECPCDPPLWVVWTGATA